jgi:hypothetical protein
MELPISEHIRPTVSYVGQKEFIPAHYGYSACRAHSLLIVNLPCFPDLSIDLLHDSAQKLREVLFCHVVRFGYFDVYESYYRFHSHLTGNFAGCMSTHPVSYNSQAIDTWGAILPPKCYICVFVMSPDPTYIGST